MDILDYFDRIRIINLPDRHDRRREMERSLTRSGIPADHEKVEFFPAIRPSGPAGFPSVGARGCFLSHLEVLRQARSDGVTNILIMEDDLEIDPRFVRDRMKIIDQLRGVDWGFAYFGHSIEWTKEPIPHLEPYSGPIVLAHFYAVDGRILDPLVAFLDAMLLRPPGDPDGGPMHVDGAFTTFRLGRPGLTTLVANPNLGTQRRSRSDIAPRRWFDRLPIAREGVTALRGFANHLVSRRQRA